MDRKYFIVFEPGFIADVGQYAEGTGIYLPDGKGVLIHDDTAVIKTILGAYGITDFTKINLFEFPEI